MIVGIMARYGSDKIRGHGIPEALEARTFVAGGMTGAVVSTTSRTRIDCNGSTVYSRKM